MGWGTCWGEPFRAGGVNRISGSTAGGTVTGAGDLAGGLVGWNNGPISSSHATGDVIGGFHWVGGLVGTNFGDGGVNRISGSTAARHRDRHRLLCRWIGRMEQRPDQQQPCHQGRDGCPAGWGACWDEQWSQGR